MPAATPISMITMPGWTNGANRDADPYQLEVTESPDAENVDFGVRGRVSKRKGYASFDEVAALASAPRAMKSWKTVAGSETLFYIADDGTILVGTGAPLADSTKDVGTWSLNEEYRVGIASLNDVVYFTSLGAGANIPSYDGSSWVDVATTIFDGTAIRFPKAQHLVTHVDRIFAANVENTGGTRFASRVHWSDALDAETWTASNFIDFDPDDGQQITAMHEFGENLVIFKDHRLQLLTGKSEDSFERYNLDSEIGTTAPGTIVPFSTMLYFFDPSTGVHRFDGSAIYPVDDAINQYLLDGQNRTQSHKAHAYIHEGKYYLSLAWGTNASPNRTFVLDLTTNSWTEYTYGLQASAVFGNKRLGGGPNGVLGIFTMHTGLDDDGVAIEAYFYTPWVSPADTPSAAHRLRRLDTIWEAIDDIDVRVEMFRDFSRQSAIYDQAIDTDPSGSLWGTAVWGLARWGSPRDEVYSKTTGWGNLLWSAVQFKVSVTGLTDDFALNRLTMIVSTRARVRGEI